LFVVIAGPTGTGKSETAVETALKINGEIISADSMQIYRSMDIGTYKIKEEEMRGVPHHMISAVEPDRNFSVSRFKKKAEKLMDSIKKRGRIPVIAGGTGLYIHAVVKGLFDADEAQTSLKEHLRELLKEKGKGYLYSMLKQKDPEEARVIDKDNPRRLIRALEIIMTHGKKVSDLKKNTAETAYRDACAFFVLKMDRKKLCDRIDARVDSMVEGGLVEEVEALRKAGVKDSAVSMQAIGYKEIIDYIHGKTSKSGAILNIKQNTRKYAKRQVTWFKKYEEAVWIDVTNRAPKQAAGEIIKILNSSLEIRE